MSLICVASAGGSPGATTTSLALLASWPQLQWHLPNPKKHIFVEANPDGGVLAIRYQLSIEPGLTSLAAAERYELNAEQFLQHTQELPGGMLTILAPDSPDQAEFSLQTSAEGISKALAEIEEFVSIVDCGRVTPTSPAFTFCEVADFVIMVARPESEQLIPASHRLQQMKERNIKAGWVLIGDAPYSATQVEENFGFKVIGIIPNDKKGAKILAKGGKPKKLKKSALMRSAKKLADYFVVEERMLSVEIGESSNAS